MKQALYFHTNSRLTISTVLRRLQLPVYVTVNGLHYLSRPLSERQKAELQPLIQTGVVAIRTYK